MRANVTTLRAYYHLSNEEIEADTQFDSGLVRWYRNIIDTQFSSYSLGDLARALRQNLALEFIIPISLDYIQQNILAGEGYEGQLLASFQTVQDTFWRDNPEMAKTLLSIFKTCDHSLIREEFEEEEYKDLVNYINKIQ